MAKVYEVVFASCSVNEDTAAERVMEHVKEWVRSGGSMSVTVVRDSVPILETDGREVPHARVTVHADRP